MSQLLNSGGRMSSLALSILSRNDTILKVKGWKVIILRLEKEIELIEQLISAENMSVFKKTFVSDRDINTLNSCKKILKRLKPNDEEKI